MPIEEIELTDYEDDLLDEAARIYGPAEANLRDLYLRSRRSAWRRGLTWTLTLDDFRKLIESPCFWSGVKPRRKHFRRGGSKESEYRAKAITWNGIDRIDPDRGYEVDNCVASASEVNFMRGDLLAPDFRSWVRRIERSLRGRRLPRGPGQRR